MIAPTQLKPPAPIAVEMASAPPALPKFRRLATGAVALVGLPVALCLLAGKLWLAMSCAGGAALSLLVCALLYGFVAHGMANLGQSLREPGGAAARGGSMAAFGALLVSKCVLVGLAGYALMSVRQINLLCVLIGFLLAQTAIVVTATRHFKKPII